MQSRTDTGAGVRDQQAGGGCSTARGVRPAPARRSTDELRYPELFGWESNADNPMRYGMVAREGNVNPEGIGIGGGVGGGPEGYEGHVTFYMEVPDVEAALARAETLGGSRVMGPEEIMGQVVLGQFRDPEGHLVGVVQAAS